MLELVYEVDHVLAHGRPLYPVHEPAVLQSRVLGLHLLHHLLAKGTHFGRTGDGHVLVTVISGGRKTIQLYSIAGLTGDSATYWLLTP